MPSNPNCCNPLLLVRTVLRELELVERKAIARSFGVLLGGAELLDLMEHEPRLR